MSSTTNQIVSGVSGLNAAETESVQALVEALGNDYTLSKVLSQSGIPMLIPSSGTIGNNGALSAITALGDAYLPQGMYMYFPTNAIAVGVPAGMYYVLLATTTTGTIYNNTYTSGKPTTPVSPTPFVTTGPGAYTQTTATDITLLSMPIAASELGPNGSIIGFQRWTLNSSAGTKTMTVKLGAQTAWSNNTLTTSGLYEHGIMIGNRGSAQRQQCNRTNNTGFQGAVSGTATNINVDTSLATTLSVVAQIGTATDFLGVSWHSFELRPGA